MGEQEKPARTESDADASGSGTTTDEIYLRELIRLQLVVSVAGVVAFGGVIVALPLVLLLVPSLNGITVAGIPARLLLLGPPPFILFVAIGWLYRRRADALDVEYADLVRSP